MSRFVRILSSALCIFLLSAGCAFSPPADSSVRSGDGKTAAAKSAAEKPDIVNGYLVDMVCVRDEAVHLAELGPKHTTKCLKMPACMASGYALLLPSNEMLQFDSHGNELAAKLIEATHRDGDWRMRATGKREGNNFLVKTLELEKPKAPAKRIPGRKKSAAAADQY